MELERTIEQSEERRSSYACARLPPKLANEGKGRPAWCEGSTSSRTSLRRLLEDDWVCGGGVGVAGASEGARRQLETTAVSLPELAAASEERYELTDSMGGTSEVLSASGRTLEMSKTREVCIREQRD